MTAPSPTVDPTADEGADLDPETGTTAADPAQLPNRTRILAHALALDVAADRQLVAGRWWSDGNGALRVFDEGEVAGVFVAEEGGVGLEAPAWQWRAVAAGSGRPDPLLGMLARIEAQAHQEADLQRRTLSADRRAPHKRFRAPRRPGGLPGTEALVMVDYVDTALAAVEPARWTLSAAFASPEQALAHRAPPDTQLVCGWDAAGELVAVLMPLVTPVAPATAPAVGA